MIPGAYYFDGWSGHHPLANDPNVPWAHNAPTHLTKRLAEEFAGREPLWGWRSDTLESMEQQIDLAADHGLAFFSFCWYWHKDPKEIEKDPKHTGLRLFLRARNSQRMQFCLLVANHGGFAIEGAKEWKQAADMWMPYLTHERALRIGGKPLLIIFNSAGGNREGFEYLQELAHDAGLPGVAIAGVGRPPKDMGYTLSTHYASALGWGDRSESHSYAELVTTTEQRWAGSAQEPHIPLVTGGWDSRPWEGPNGHPSRPVSWHFLDRTPTEFAKHLRNVARWMDTHPAETTQERAFIIYAWNEYGEGGYIAPTKEDPQGEYLKVLGSFVMP